MLMIVSALAPASDAQHNPHTIASPAPHTAPSRGAVSSRECASPLPTSPQTRCQTPQSPPRAPKSLAKPHCSHRFLGARFLASLPRPMHETRAAMAACRPPPAPHIAPSLHLAACLQASRRASRDCTLPTPQLSDILSCSPAPLPHAPLPHRRTPCRRTPCRRTPHR